MRRARYQRGSIVFDKRLEFNSHVHTLVTGGGLNGCSWIARIYFDRDRLMKAWRRAVIRLLRAALGAGQLLSKSTNKEVGANLSLQESRWWSTNIQSFNSKVHFLRYAGRYVKRPPIAQRRIIHIGEQTVTFWAKNKREHRRVAVRYSLEEFLDRWSQHIPERYQHAVRGFGLFSPRTLARTSEAIFTLQNRIVRISAGMVGILLNS